MRIHIPIASASEDYLFERKPYKGVRFKTAPFGAIDGICYDTAPTKKKALTEENSELVEELKRELQSSFDTNVAPVVKAIEQRTAELEANFTKRMTAADEIIDEIKARMKQGGAIDPETGYRVNAFGQVAPSVSKEVGELARAVFRKDTKFLQKYNEEYETRELGESGALADGAALVFPERTSELLQLITQYGSGRKNVFIVPMKTLEKKYPALVSGVETYWAEENPTSDFTESSPTFGEITLIAKTLVGMTHVSQQLLEDSDPAIYAILVDLFMRAGAREEDKQIFCGTGTGADPFYGILNAPGTNVVTMDESTFDGINTDYMLDMQTATPTPAHEGAKYYLNRTIFDYVRKLKDADGNYILQMPSAGSPGTIHGKPYELVEIMPGREVATGSQAGKPFVAYGNLRYYYMGDRRSIEFARNDVMDTAFRRLKIFLRMHERVACKLSQPSAITVLKTHP